MNSESAMFEDNHVSVVTIIYGSSSYIMLCKFVSYALCIKEYICIGKVSFPFLRIVHIYKCLLFLKLIVGLLG